MSEARNPLIAQSPPALAPLANSHEADQVEAELKALFMFLLEEYARPGEREINTAAIPHRGSFEQMERAVKTEGLALLRRGDPETMRYIFKAWRARNPKRGLHMLRLYLRMLWPGAWSANQMWCKKGGVYPVDLRTTDGGNHFLTSRVQVRISSAITDGEDVASVAPALRSVVPARFVLSVAIEQSVDVGLGIATVAYQGAVIQNFEANCI